MWKHNQSAPYGYDAGELYPSRDGAGSPKLPAALPHDEAASRMSDEGCPNEAVETVPDGTGYSGDPAHAE